MLDHFPLDTMRRHLGLQKAEQLWQLAYHPAKPFHIGLTEPAIVVQDSVQSRRGISCSHQFKLYYQVSLPPYKDDLFLKKAVERYEHYLCLTRLHPVVFMVPCYDFDLIWHAHQRHPLNSQANHNRNARTALASR